MHGRSREVRRLLQELVDNGHRHGEAPVRLIVESGPEGVAITVADGGPGVPPADRARVLEPYGRLERDSDGPGVGLGLTIARRLAAAMRADLEVLDTPVGGTAVRVTFPPAGS